MAAAPVGRLLPQHVGGSLCSYPQGYRTKYRGLHDPPQVDFPHRHPLRERDDSSKIGASPCAISKLGGFPRRLRFAGGLPVQAQG